jgi:hypothetical protein
MKAPFSTALAIAVGLIVLAGYFLSFDLLINLRKVLLEWGLILLAVALLVGIFNLFSVHWKKIITAQRDGLYSMVLIGALILTLAVVGWFGPAYPYSLWIFNNIQFPIETSLMAILLVILVFAAFRLLSRRANLLSVIFIITVVVILLTTGPLFGMQVPGLNELRDWVARVPAAAGARGILLGVSLGIVATGLRILMGADRPYRG